MYTVSELEKIEVHVHSMYIIIAPEAAHISFGKVTVLGVLCCFALLFV